MASAKHRRGATDRTAAQDKDNRNRIGSRVWLHLDGEKRTTGILLSAYRAAPLETVRISV